MNTQEYYVYDLETFPNCFLFCGKFAGNASIDMFEISDRMNDRHKLLAHLDWLKNRGSLMVGFNSIHFDYPILHELLLNPFTFTATTASLKAYEIIHSGGGFGQGYGREMIWMKDRLLPQVDLVKINHFDNANRRTSLKTLQFAMRAKSVEDLPFEIRALSHAEMDTLRTYNIHDVLETERFFEKCKHLIEMRQELLNNGTLTGDVLNFSDVKIGYEYLIKKIGRSKCFVSGSNPRQTYRESVPFKDVILPKIFFRTEEFGETYDWFRSQVYKKDDPNPSLETELAGLHFKFGVGGVHASVQNRVYVSDEKFVIRDIDVAGMYPSICVANRFAPEHLGDAFVSAYAQTVKDRSQYPKKSSMNKMLKLAANGGGFGKTDDMWSAFYDPKCAKSVTINGQLQLLQLAEMLSLIPGIELIQCNTDGITAKVPRTMDHLFKLWTDDWQVQTGLKLEEVEYAKMWIRDVNNYLCVTTKGDVKRKGAYWYPEKPEDYEGVWNKDFSMMVVQKAIEQCLITGIDPADVIRLMHDKFDFMLRYKTPAGAKVYVGEKEASKTLRYYVSKTGQPAKKVAAPKGRVGEFKRRNSISDDLFLSVRRQIPAGQWDERIHTKNKSKYEEVTTSIEAGRLVKECNHVKDFNWDDVDFDYYIEEVKKLVIA